MKYSRLKEEFLDLLFPPSLYCICCGNLIDETRTYHLCDHCMDHMRWDFAEPICKDGLPMLRCAQYGIYERTLIFSLKYNQKKYIARDIAEICFDRLRQVDVSFDLIIPVPISKEKRRRRGFNQTELISKHLARLARCKNLPDGLLRTRDTRPMRGLSPEERRENVRGSIAVNPERSTEIAGSRILLLDDFFTTGSTALACYHALAEMHPKSVVFLAFAAK